MAAFSRFRPGVSAGLLLLFALFAAAPSSAAVTDTFTGSVSSTGTAFRSHTFSVTSPGTLTITLDWDDATANLNEFLYDPSGTQVASAATTTKKPEVISYQVKQTGTWKVGVKAAAGTANYTVSVDQSPPQTAPVTPSFNETIGGPGHAEMYPSGLEVDPSGNLYIADTGGDQIASYAPDGTQRWRIGTRGPKTLSEFVDPRDVAFLNGTLYVGDTGNLRVVTLDAATGQPTGSWAYKFGTILGVSAAQDAAGNPVILVTQDNRNTVGVFTPSGTLLRTVGTGPGTGNGQLKAPRDAATDSHGNIYVADYANNRVAKFAPDGTWLMNWGVTGTANGRFQRPYGIDIDANDVVYVADSNNERIQKFTTSGGFVGTWGSAGTGNGQFFQLRRVVVGSGPTPLVYAADLWGYNVQRFTSTGTFQFRYGGSVPGLGLFNEPSGLAVDSNVFVADAVNQRVQQFELGGSFDAAWGHRGWGTDLLGFAWPRDLTVNATTGKIWVADTKDSRLIEYTRNGTPTGRKAGQDGGIVGSLHWPIGIASAGADVIVADTGNNRVQRWDGNGLTVEWTATGLLAPSDVTVVGSNVYVADAGDHQIVELDAATGARITSFGSADLHSPTGIAVDAAGDFWVADTTWNRLVEFSPTFQRIQVFGSLGTGPTQFNNPTKLEISAGKLYVADQWNDRVQVFSIG